MSNRRLDGTLERRSVGGGVLTINSTFTICGLFVAPPDVTVIDPKCVPAPNPIGLTPTVNEAGVVPFDGFNVIHD